MEFPIKFDTVMLGWSIVYIEGLQVVISKNIIFLYLKVLFYSWRERRLRGLDMRSVLVVQTDQHVIFRGRGVGG